ncbi:hypothetical protein PHJA_000305100 [Phtheirospermum japonicum]|uniref:Uncharacterized protein n=1 Tax=Phtheirospermum japonicum TaxID=374723 RepID=A0A830B972_9LAMI|nr:hypothetical protein PHJA_000305100 [Phtheirospermum japonicum]
MAQLKFTCKPNYVESPCCFIAQLKAESKPNQKIPNITAFFSVVIFSSRSETAIGTAPNRRRLPDLQIFRVMVGIGSQSGYDGCRELGLDGFVFLENL